MNPIYRIEYNPGDVTGDKGCHIDLDKIIMIGDIENDNYEASFVVSVQLRDKPVVISCRSNIERSLESLEEARAKLLEAWTTYRNQPARPS